jgi:hypothetical protein
MLVAEPRVVAREICRIVERSIPTRSQVRGLSQQLLTRHSVCRLKPVVSSEEVVEAYYRCVITAGLASRYTLAPISIPCCINSSHRAVSRVCVSPARHAHAAVEDHKWRNGWRLIQGRNPEVNVRVAGRPSPKRADLYVVASGQVVSLEFKYVDPRGIRDINGCAAQVRRHAECHSQAILVLYSGGNKPVPDRMVQQIVLLTAARNVRVANLAGPEIPITRGAA